jgi:hypothetical protein
MTTTRKHTEKRLWEKHNGDWGDTLQTGSKKAKSNALLLTASAQEKLPLDWIGGALIASLPVFRWGLENNTLEHWIACPPTML